MQRREPVDREREAPFLAELAAERSPFGLAIAGDASGLFWSNEPFQRAASKLGLELTEAPTSMATLRQRFGAANEFELRESPAGQSSTGESLLCLALFEARPRQVAVEESGYPSTIDEVTGVLTRSGLRAELDRRFAAANARPFALVFLDLDDFKRVNDEQGHLAGDDCLRAVGESLRHAVRSNDTVGRFGGDEFVVLLDGVESRAELEPICQRLAAVGSEVTVRGKPLQQGFGVSLGVALTADGYATPEDLLHAADRRMYDAKRRKERG